MNPTKAAKLQATGWTLGNADEFLGLSPEESAMVDLRVQISQRIRELRTASGLTQKQFAAKLKTSQPRIAKVEAAAADVSFDTLIRGLLALGGTIQIGKPNARIRKPVSAG